MFEAPPNLSRRDLLVVAAVTGVVTMMPSPLSAETGTVKPFRVHVPEEAIIDLRRRIAATRWPT
ncbi:MAG: multidrug MFS transporter, partial [Sphingomonas hengshuiensis]